MQLDFSGLVSQNPAIEGTAKVRQVERVAIQVEHPKEGVQEQIADIRVANYRNVADYADELLTLVRGRSSLDYQFEQRAVRHHQEGHSGRVADYALRLVSGN